MVTVEERKREKSSGKNNLRETDRSWEKRKRKRENGKIQKE